MAQMLLFAYFALGNEQGSQQPDTQTLQLLDVINQEADGVKTCFLKVF